MSPKFKRVSSNEPSGFPFWGLIICVDFYLKNFKKGEYEKINEIIFHNKDEYPQNCLT